jgi:opacity protein-like surface antigen
VRWRNRQQATDDFIVGGSMRSIHTVAIAVAISAVSVHISTSAHSAPVYDWTGFYLGTHIGTAAAINGWQSGSGAASQQPFPDSYTSGGVMGGLQLGYNFQFGRWVFGAEADASLADIEGAARCSNGVYVCNTKIDGLGTFAARGGYTFGNLMIYGKAGGAWLHESVDLTPTPGVGIVSIPKGNETRWAPMVGAGLEYAFYPNLSAKIEYNYLNFDSGTLTLTDQLGAAGQFGVQQQLHIVKLGLNYKFGGIAQPGEGWPSLGSVGGSRHHWTGLYVGVHGGGSWGTTNWKSADGFLGAVSTSTFAGTGTMDGMIGGGQVGYNYQFGRMVAGIETDVSAGNLDGFAKCATTENATAAFTCHSRIETLGTVTGRLGVTWDNLLIYGKGGFAWADEKHDVYRQDLPNVFQGSSTRVGYTAGAGLEYAFSPAWSARTEYRYLDFGTQTLVLTDTAGGGGTSNVALAQRSHIAMLGVNYKFGADPGGAYGSSGEQAYASGLPLKAPRAVLSDWEIEAGTRYWHSNGKSQQDLFDAGTPQQVNSRLIYGGMTGHSLEGFARLDHRSGVFVKGNFGLGSLVDGKLNDEDQPPGTTPYSNTTHSMKDGSMRNGAADVGLNVLSGPAGRIGPYVGYRYFYQRGRGYGCDQIGPGNVCVPSIANNILGLTETEQYRGFAVGLNSRLALSNRLSFDVDAAFLPFADRAGVDNHWLRADINPGPENGRAWGTQLEGILNYAVSDRWNVGVGGRYWFFTTTNGASHFPNSADTTPLKFTSERYGAFVQTSYKFGGGNGGPAPESLPPAEWNGVYAGTHLGAGFGRSDWADPFPKPPSGDYNTMGGALGGLQLGINRQFGKWVIGAEVAASLAQLEGSNTCFGGDPNTNTAAQECESKTHGLGLLTGRLGYAFGRSLVYGRAGGALAREAYVLNTGAAGGAIDTQRATNTGWVVGGGLEHALTDRWSVNAEYKYIDFGSRVVHFNVPAAIGQVGDTSIRSERQMVTLGVNYSFEGLR